MRARTWVTVAVAVAATSVGGYFFADAVWSGEPNDATQPTGRSEGPFFFSSVEQNGGTPAGGLSILSGVPEGCTPTRDAYDWATNGGLTVDDVLVSSGSGEVRVTAIDSDGYRNFTFTLSGTADEPLVHTQPVDACLPLLVTMDANTSLVELSLISPSGVEYSPTTAQDLGADLYVLSDFMSMDVREPEAGDWTIRMSPKQNAPGALQGRFLLQQPRPKYEPYAVCEATVTGNTISVDARKSWDEDGTVTEYFWEFPDYSVVLEPTFAFDATAYPDGDYYFPCILTDNDDNRTFSGVIVTLGAAAEAPATAASRTYSSLDNPEERDPGPSTTGDTNPERACDETRTAWDALQQREIAYGTVLESSDAGRLSEGSSHSGFGSIHLDVVFNGTGSTPIRHTELLDSCRGLVTHMQHPGGSAGMYSLVSPSGKVYAAGMPPEAGVDASSNSEYDDYRIREPEAGKWTLVFDPSTAVPGATYPVVFAQDSPILYPPQPVCTVTVTGHDLAVDASESVAGDAPIATYTWTFPDGVTATGATATHTLGSGWKGYQWVSCSVTATDGQSAHDGVSIPID